MFNVVSILFYRIARQEQRNTRAPRFPDSRDHSMRQGSAIAVPFKHS
jgi:hypothetical protein